MPTTEAPAREGFPPKSLFDLDGFLAIIKAEIIPHDINLAALSLEIFCRYGKEIDPKASLNFCDRVAYALVKALNEHAAALEGQLTMINQLIYYYF